jgi:hypothetical protein
MIKQNRLSFFELGHLKFKHAGCTSKEAKILFFWENAVGIWGKFLL